VIAPLVLVTSRSFSTGTDDLIGRLNQAGARVVRGAIDHDLKSIRPELENAVAWIAGTSPVTAQHLAAAPKLRLIARYGVGVDAVDRDAAARAGVTVTNTPGANSDAVAEHALALLFAALRRIVSGDRSVRAQDWTVLRTKEMRNIQVGIVGFGRIGRALTTRLLPFGTRVLAYDPVVPAPDIIAAGAEPAELRALPATCDVVSLHAPGGNLIVDAGWLGAATPELILLNTARAALVDEHAVATALSEHRIRCYAADDLGSGHGDASSPLLATDLADRVILTPHSAAQTVEAVDNMGSAATAAVLAVLAGTTPPNVIAPPLSCPSTD